MTTLIFVRHGESLGNLNKEFLGHTDLDLSPKGYRQAELTAEYIKQNFKLDKIFSSDLIRAYNTAKAVDALFNIGIEKDKNLREIYAGNWEKKTFSQIESEYPEDYTLWLNDIGNAKCSGGESTAELQKRALAEVIKIAEENDGKTILIATHATFIRAVECAWHGVGLDRMKDFPWVKNASVSVAEYEKGEWNIKLIGECGFLGDLVSNLPANV